MGLLTNNFRTHMKKKIIAALCLIAATTTSWAQTPEEMQYRRSSIYSLMVSHSDRKFNSEITSQFIALPVPDKYNDHDLSVKVVTIAQNKKVDPELIQNFLERNGVASRLVAKWFDRDFTNGVCNVDLLKERGLYNASEMDKAIAAQTQRGQAMLEDAGEELIGNTFVLVNDIRYIDKSSVGKAIGAFLRFTGEMVSTFTKNDDYAALGNMTGDMAETFKGFKVKIYTHLFQLVWDDVATDAFYRNIYTETPDVDKVKFMEAHRGLFKLKYIGTQESDGSTTSFLGIKSDEPLMMVRKACQRALDDNVANLQKNFDAFKVKVPLLGVEPITAPIGKKEGITKKSKFEVLEVSEEDGRTVYKRVGVIEPLPNRIWDNRFMAVEERAEGATLGYTTFRKVSGGDFYPGMLIREIK